MDITEDRLNKYRAKRIRFFINGDEYFRGINYALNTEKIRSFEYLLNDLNRLLNEHSIALIKGVRCIFSLDGQCIKNLSEFQEGQAYVCSSIDTFVEKEYPVSNGVFNWLVRNSACISASKVPRNQKTTTPVPRYSARLSRTPNDTATQLSHLVSPMYNRSKSPAVRIRQSLPSPMTNKSAVKPILSTKVSGQSVKPGTQHQDNIYKPNGNCSLISRGDTPENRQTRQFEKTKNIDKDCRLTGSSSQDDAHDYKANEKSSSHNSSTRVGRQRVSNIISDSINPKQVSRKSNTKDVVNRSLTIKPNNAYKTQQPLGNGKPAQKVDQKVLSDTVKVSFPLEVITRYDVGCAIGDGHFSVVYCCMNKETQEFYALKLINKLVCPGNEDMIYNEVKILKRLEHPNIVKFIEEFDFPQQIYLILELVQDGDLYDAIATCTSFKEDDVSTMICNLSSALNYLHSQAIVHRDIKPENLLISTFEDGSQSLKLADFGLAIEKTSSPLFNVCGTAYYVSPEMLKETGYDYKVDVWSTGVICYILLCGTPPFMSENDSNDELFDAILAGDFHFPPATRSKISSQAKELIKSMLTVIPEKRFTAEQVFNDPWTRGESSNFEGINPLNLSRLAALQRSL